MALAHRVKIQRHIQIGCGKQGVGRVAGKHRFEGTAFEQAAVQLEPQVRLVKVNTEDHPNLAARFNIRSIPTLALFQGGREVARQAGAMRSAADIARWVQANQR